jgi:cell wall-associated NlpC family hydrolase
MTSSILNKYPSIQFLAFILTPILFIQSCGSSETAQNQSSARAYEVADQEKEADQDSLLLAKYSQKLYIEPQTIEPSITLYKFIDKNIKTPCSEQTGENTTNDVALAQRLFNAVYNRKIPGSYEELFSTNLIEKFSNTSHLTEGDLMFFEEEAEEDREEQFNPAPLEKLVGVYLRNNRFISCAEEDGAVAISNFNRRYWKGRYKAAGRLK